MHKISENSLSYVLLFLLGLIWGSSFLFIKFTVISLEPITAVLLRMTVAASCLFVYLKIQKIILPLEKKDITKNHWKMVLSWNGILIWKDFIPSF